MTAESADSIDLLHDMADYMQELIIKDAESRTQESWDTMKEFYTKYCEKVRVSVSKDDESDDSREFQEGRLYVRYQMCQIMLRAWSWEPYDFDQEIAMVNWKEQKWAQLLDFLAEIQETSSEPSKLYGKVQVACQVHRALAKVRRKLESHVRGKEDGEPNFDSNEMSSLLQSISDGGLAVKARAQHLLFSSGDGKTVFRGTPELQSGLRSSLFSFHRLQKNIEKLVFEWNDTLFRLQEATMWSLGYELPEIFQSSDEDEEEDLETTARQPKQEKIAHEVPKREKVAQEAERVHTGRDSRERVNAGNSKAGKPYRADLKRRLPLQTSSRRDLKKQLRESWTFQNDEQDEEEARTAEPMSNSKKSGKIGNRSLSYDKSENAAESASGRMSKSNPSHSSKKRKSRGKAHDVSENGTGLENLIGRSRPSPGIIRTQPPLDQSKRQRSRESNRTPRENMKRHIPGQSPHRKRAIDFATDDSGDNSSGVEQEIPSNPSPQKRNRESNGTPDRLRENKRRYLPLQTSPQRKRATDSTSEDSDDGSDVISLGDIPPKQRSFYCGQGPDDQRFDNHGNVIRRCRWSKEEVAALKLGIKRYGVGKWVSIKNDFDEILRNRTSVMLKDKYRNMLKAGELRR